MTLPRPWPFMSPLAERPRPSDQPEPKMCECHGDGIELDEIADNKCARCGKPLIVEVP